MPRGGKPPPAKKGEPQLPAVTRAKGIVALGRMALRIVQQQLGDMQGKKLDAYDRDFLLAATKTLLEARKAKFVLTKDGPTGGVPLPALEPKT